ncbi:hypothetical protein yaldo0001_27950 [Yersinia aldovae ATCC 35236]|nr:hypothetical protein yaldo0001_27950 [Yersinia aldovae ATCC 35236]
MDEIAINLMLSGCFNWRKRLLIADDCFAFFLNSLTALHQGLRMLLSEQRQGFEIAATFL